MSQDKNLLTIPDLRELIEQYYIILYPGNWDVYGKQVRRIVEKDLKEGVDYSIRGSIRYMTRAQALRFVTSNDSLRKYFLRVMDKYNDNEESRRKYQEIFDAEDDELAAISAEEAQREEDDGQRIEPVRGIQEERPLIFNEEARLYEEDELLIKQEVDKAAMKALLNMFADQGAATLYDYFGIDRDKFTQAYAEYKARCRNIVNGGDFRGLSERRFKLQRPTIYYHI